MVKKMCGLNYEYSQAQNLVYKERLRLRFARKFKNMCGLNYEYPQAQNLVKKKVEAEICPKA